MTDKDKNIELELGRKIEESITCTSDLLIVMESENHAITQRDSNLLASLLAEKQIKMSLLEELESNRKKLLMKNGFPTDTQGMELFEREYNMGILSAQWQHLLELFDQLKTQNRINGSLINLTHFAVERSLQIIQGKSSENKLYDPSGQEIASHQCRSLAKF